MAPPLPLDRNARIILLHPSTHGGVRSLFTFHKNEGLGHKPPMAILILATWLRQRGFANVHCQDAQLEGHSPEESVAALLRQQPAVVGITTWTDFWYPVWRTVALIRAQLPHVIIILGGPHCAVFPEETLRHSAADYLVAGDGEEALLALMEELVGERPAGGEIPGLWRQRNGQVTAPVQPLAIVREVERIPSPDRTLLPVRRYTSVLNPGEYESTMITSRGCPHRCVFCKMHSQTVYCRTAIQVVDEFQACADLGITDVQVYDDTFGWSPQRVRDICQGIIDRGISMRWAVRDRVRNADPHLFRLMRQAGCYRIHFGVESGSPRILKASGKGITLGQAEEAMAAAKEAGFETLTFFMFGFLDETYDDALKTIDFAIRLDADYAVFAVLIPYPDTRIYQDALERGVLREDFWLRFVRDPTPDFVIPQLIEQHMDRATLIDLRDLANRRYYFRPRVIGRELLRLRSWREVRSKMGMARNIVTDSLEGVLGRWR